MGHIFRMTKLLNRYLLGVVTQCAIVALLLSTNISYAQQAKSNNFNTGIVGYYQSWSAHNTDDGTTTELAQLPSAYTVVNLSFMREDASYQPGQKTFDGTGLLFGYSPAILKQSIATLKKRNPQTKILVSVGGEGPTNWDGLNAKDIGAFVKDFNLDGVDIDFEASGHNISCVFPETGDVNCNTDQKYIDVVNKLRAELPREEGYLISLAGFSTGAYGEKTLLWENAKPGGSPFTGVMINLLKEAGDTIDMVQIMAYDADEGRSGYSSKEAFDAYKHYYDGQLFLGIEIPPEAWGHHALTRQKAAELARYVKDNGGAGMMLWGITKFNKVEQGVDAQCLTMTMCTELGRDDCLDIKNVCPLSETV